MIETDEPAAPVPLVTVLIVTYNSRSTIRAAIDGLVGNCEIVLVDNASLDGTADFIESAYGSRVILIRSGENLGFAKAVNRAAENASGKFLLLLNPDASMDYENIGLLTVAMSAYPEVGVAAPDVIEGAGEFRTMAAGYEPSVRRMFLHSSGLSRLGRHTARLRGHYLLRDQIRPNRPEFLKWVSGGCMLVERTVWQNLGGLSERWFMYAEDVEFCLRASSAGWKVAVFPWAFAHHSVGGSSDDSSGPVRTVWLENLYDLFVLRYHPSTFRAASWRGVVAVGFAARSSVFALLTSVRPAYRSDARRFAAYARAAWTLPSPRPVPSA
ncbi:glycosyltransferase family 2 protein [Microbacterium testaceum]|uniref:glycosyltransferase family 2 protein n=1 Tax=Microbacterium testaceum TaxID=2033 RepID=UPI002434E32C|nr:glycosyltransferase family 2 protein [Microbacterium testaceum]